MKRSEPQALELRRSSGGPPLTDLPAVNVALAADGTRLWPLDLRDVPPGIRQLIGRPSLDADEAQRLLRHFLLPRERLLALIQAAGREPHVPGVGELSTRVRSHGYRYPQLWVAEAGADYARFDRFHRNRADDGTGVDEVWQMLCGRDFEIVRRLPDGEVLTLRLGCPDPGRGWLGTYDGATPHMGRFTPAEPGTKVLVQAIGPPTWSIHYEPD